MDRHEIKSELIRLITTLLNNVNFDVDVIEHFNFIDDLGMDSILFISMIVEIEMRFNIVIPDNMLLIDNFKTLDRAIEIIEHEILLK